ncbi:hypothetical protein ACNKHR_15515 [Shigella flexneri]
MKYSAPPVCAATSDVRKPAGTRSASASYIDRFRAKATKAKQAQSRIKMLERMERIAPAHVDNPFRSSFSCAGKPAKSVTEDGKSQRGLWRLHYSRLD